MLRPLRSGDAPPAPITAFCDRGRAFAYHRRLRSRLCGGEPRRDSHRPRDRGGDREGAAEFHFLRGREATSTPGARATAGTARVWTKAAMDDDPVPGTAHALRSSTSFAAARTRCRPASRSCAWRWRRESAAELDDGPAGGADAASLRLDAPARERMPRFEQLAERPDAWPLVRAVLAKVPHDERRPGRRRRLVDLAPRFDRAARSRPKRASRSIRSAAPIPSRPRPRSRALHARCGLAGRDARPARDRLRHRPVPDGARRRGRKDRRDRHLPAMIEIAGARCAGHDNVQIRLSSGKGPSGIPAAEHRLRLRGRRLSLHRASTAHGLAEPDFGESARVLSPAATS